MRPHPHVSESEKSSWKIQGLYVLPWWQFMIRPVLKQTFGFPEGFRAPRGVRKSGKTEPATPGVSYGEFATGATRGRA